MRGGGLPGTFSPQEREPGSQERRSLDFGAETVCEGGRGDVEAVGGRVDSDALARSNDTVGRNQRTCQMHAAQFVFVVACALQQVSMREEVRLGVINNTRADFFEFRIRASDRHREWTSVRLDVGESKSIHLVSPDPFDVEIWRWEGDDRWVVSRQSEVYLKDHDEGGSSVRLERLLTDSSGDKPISYGIEYGAIQTWKRKNRKSVQWRLEPNPFRLIVPR